MFSYMLCSSFRMGPMNADMKRRKAYQRRKRGNPTDNDTPKEVRVLSPGRISLQRLQHLYLSIA